MKHRRKERVRHPMARNVDQHDSRHSLAKPEVLRNLELSPRDRVLDSGGEVEPPLEIHVDDVVASYHAVEGKRAAVHVDPLKAGNVAGAWQQVFSDLLEVVELAAEVGQVARVSR